MALKKTTAKLNEYYERLEHHDAERIKVKHVDKVIVKLQAKGTQLDEELKAAKKSSKKSRLKRKKKVLNGQLQRAEFLRKEISKKK